MAWPLSESQMAEVLVPWLEDEGWDVWPEVQVNAYGGIFDIVAVRPAVLWIIELKRTFSLSLIAQAKDRRAYAHWVSVAVPSTKTLRRGIATDVFKHYGLGCLEMTSWDVNPVCEPMLLRRPPRIDDLKHYIAQGMKSRCAPGSPAKKGRIIITGFRRTADYLLHRASRS